MAYSEILFTVDTLLNLLFQNRNLMETIEANKLQKELNDLQTRAQKADLSYSKAMAKLNNVANQLATASPTASSTVREIMKRAKRANAAAIEEATNNMANDVAKLNDEVQDKQNAYFDKLANKESFVDKITKPFKPNIKPTIPNVEDKFEGGPDNVHKF